MFFSSALFALLPTIARSVNKARSATGFCSDALERAQSSVPCIMQPARARWSTEVIVSAVYRSWVWSLQRWAVYTG